jgi:hypothetical protein
MFVSVGYLCLCSNLFDVVIFVRYVVCTMYAMIM